VTHAAFDFELLLNEGSDHDWTLNRELRIAVPVERCIQQSPWGLPTATPEVVLFFKAGGDLTAAELEARNNVFRPRDEQDLFALLPILTGAQRSWLRESLGRVQLEHPWLTHLES
jgi:hypothetical protein